MALADTRTGAVLRGSTEWEGHRKKSTETEISELEGGAVLRKKKKDCVLLRAPGRAIKTILWAGHDFPKKN